MLTIDGDNSVPLCVRSPNTAAGPVPGRLEVCPDGRFGHPRRRRRGHSPSSCADPLDRRAAFGGLHHPVREGHRVSPAIRAREVPAAARGQGPAGITPSADPRVEEAPPEVAMDALGGVASPFACRARGRVLLRDHGPPHEPPRALAGWPQGLRRRAGRCLLAPVFHRGTGPGTKKTLQVAAGGSAGAVRRSVVLIDRARQAARSTRAQSPKAVFRVVRCDADWKIEGVTCGTTALATRDPRTSVDFGTPGRHRRAAAEPAPVDPWVEGVPCREAATVEVPR